MDPGISNVFISPRAYLHTSGIVTIQHAPEAIKSISSKHRIGDNGRSSRQMILNGSPSPLHRGVHCKPNCSYNCLIGMALKSSKRKSLPVNEIYTFFLNKFPYFRSNGPEGWKNSIRHSLSLGPYFRKTQIAGFQGKKGFQWEVVPDKIPSLDQEISKFLAEEGKTPQQFGIESLYSTGFRLYEALSTSRQQWTLHQSRAHTVIKSAKVETTLQSIASDSVHCSVGVSSSPCSLAVNDKKKLPVASVDEHAEKRLQSEQKSKQPLPTKEEIGGILAYLKDGAPLDTSTPQPKTISDSDNSLQANKGKVAIAETTDNSTHDMTLLDIQSDDKLAKEVKEFVISCEYPPFQQGVNSIQHDLEEWLCLELVDDIDTDVLFGIDTTPELSSVLISDCPGGNHSLNEVNYPSVLDNASKNVGHKTISTGRKEHCSENELLEPVGDWNQWNEPPYVKRMINLCNSLNHNKNSNMMEHNNNTHGKVRVNCSTRTQGSEVRNKTSKVTSKAQVKSVDRNNRTPITKKKVENCDRVKKFVNMVSDHRRIYAHKFAAVKKVSQSGIMNNCSRLGTRLRGAVSPRRSPKKRCCKRSGSSETFQLIVSISFDRLVTERQFKKYHFNNFAHAQHKTAS